MKTLNQTPEHPANEELAAFALGKEMSNAETIAEHIAHCTRCETLVAQTPRDTFLGILNKAKPGASLTGPNVPNTTPTTADELPPELRQQTKYTFLKKLGGGGMGVVYLAEHNLMKRKVAVKLIPPELIGNPAVRERFLQEVVSAAALEHPNVVRAYSAEEFGPHMLFEMEFVDGLDLGAVVKMKGPLPVNFAVSYIRQAAQGLQHGMQKSLVHRDIKPGNLMLTRTGAVKVADFGLAKFSQESDKASDHSLTGANAMMGTPDYMAPEQARDAKSADIRADIYSLGCTFYYLLTGQPPFAGKSIADLILKHWDDPRPDVGLLRNDVAPELSQYIQRMMAKEPGDRPQTPKEVVDWLAKFAKGESAKKETVVGATEKAHEILSLDDGPRPRSKTGKTGIDPGLKEARPKKKWPLIAGAIGCLLVGLAILAAAGVFKVKSKDGTIVLENLPRPAGDVVEVEIAKGVKMKLCWTPAGKATLGSPASEAERAPYEKEHEFTTRGFWLGKYAVTQEQWEALMGENPSWFSKRGGGKEKVRGQDTSKYPVENVSWNDCQIFLKKLNNAVKQTEALGKGEFVLPHEDEWEYACRGGKGNKQAFYFGESLNGKLANCDGSYPYGTATKGPYLGMTTEVGSYERLAPHPWGLCDMHGNVYQWCENWYDSEQQHRIARGGSWFHYSRTCRSANRVWNVPAYTSYGVGCRAVFRLD